MIMNTFNTMQPSIHFNARILFMDTLVIPYNQIQTMAISYTLFSSRLSVNTFKQSYIQELHFDKWPRCIRESIESDFYEAMDNWRFENMMVNVENYPNQKIINPKIINPKIINPKIINEKQ
jgi:hypothetical protein